MVRRPELHSTLRTLCRNVYFQPPESVKLVYPCIIYKLEDMPSIHADNLPYHWDHTYQVSVIDRDPDSELRELVMALPTAKFVRSFVADNLNHYIFRIYY